MRAFVRDAVDAPRAAAGAAVHAGLRVGVDHNLRTASELGDYLMLGSLVALAVVAVDAAAARLVDHPGGPAGVSRASGSAGSRPRWYVFMRAHRPGRCAARRRGVDRTGRGAAASARGYPGGARCSHGCVQRRVGTRGGRGPRAGDPPASRGRAQEGPTVPTSFRERLSDRLLHTGVELGADRERLARSMRDAARRPARLRAGGRARCCWPRASTPCCCGCPRGCARARRCAGRPPRSRVLVAVTPAACRPAM